MPRIANRLRKAAWRALSVADALMNRLYGWRFNPLYHSGAIVVALMAAILATGVYLIFFYRIGAPYESVGRITAQVWLGRWIRSFHRFASDAAVVAVAVHAIRAFAQGRSWGPRTLAWVSGLILLFVTLVCGWTGYIMVWDVQGQVLAQQGARLLDILPIFSEPISRAFVSELALPPAFFFLNLFLHVALPVGLGLILWIHVSRVARPTLFPPGVLIGALFALLLLLSLIWPMEMSPRADLYRLPGRAPYDLFYSFWLPPFQHWPAWLGWAAGGVIGGVLILAPLWTRPPAELIPPPSVVDERLCTGCEQCSLDCPWEAIDMIVRTDGREGVVARVNPSYCVSCGICAGSCAPMGVGPPARTGRDQLNGVRDFLDRWRPTSSDVIILACDRGAGGVATAGAFAGSPVLPLQCAGNLHSSVVEYLLRAGAAGVLILSCPPRDCWNREGVKWLEARLFHDREAELQERVDRRRVRLAVLSRAESAEARRELEKFREVVRTLERPAAESEIDLLRLCDAVEGERME